MSHLVFDTGTEVMKSSQDGRGTEDHIEAYRPHLLRSPGPG